MKNELGVVFTSNETRRQLVSAVTVVLISASLVAGCGKSTSDPRPEDKLADAVPTSFDPCRDIPASVLQEEQLLPDGTPISPEGAKVKEKGCDYTRSSSADKSLGEGVGVEVTNMTYDYFREVYVKQLGGGPVKEFKIGDRSAMVQGPQSNNNCTIFVSIKGGGLRFDAIGSSSAPCRDVTGFADKVVAVLAPTV